MKLFQITKTLLTLAVAASVLMTADTSAGALCDSGDNATPTPTITLAPATATPTPTTVTPALTTVTPAPTTVTPAPATVTPAPTTETPAPTTETPAPTTETPAPTTVTPAPTTVTPAPTPATPAPTTATPAPTTVTPAPTTVTPAPTAPTSSILVYYADGSTTTLANPGRDVCYSFDDCIPSLTTGVMINNVKKDGSFSIYFYSGKRCVPPITSASTTAWDGHILSMSYRSFVISKSSPVVASLPVQNFACS